MKKRITASMLLAVIVVGSGQAGQIWTGSSDHNWSNPTNWGGALPDPAQNISINGGTNNYAVYSSAEGTNGYRQVIVGDHAAGQVDVTGGSLASSTYQLRLGLGSGSLGVINVAGGDLSSSYAQIGLDGGSTAIVNLSSGSIHLTSTGGSYSGLQLPGNGTAVMNVSGGLLSTRGGMWLGYGSGVGEFNVIGGAATINIGGEATHNGYWKQESGCTLGISINSLALSNQVSTIEIDGSSSGSTGYATFDSGSLLNVGFTNGSPIDGSWDILHCSGTLDISGLAFAPGVDNTSWTMQAIDTDTSGTPDTLRISYSSAPDFFLGPTTPANGTADVTNFPTISVTVTNGSSTVDTSAFTLALNSVDVSSNVVVSTPATGVTTFSYTPVSPLDYGTGYTVDYQVVSVGGTTNIASFSFTTATDVFFGVSPSDGSTDISTNTPIVVTATNGAVSLVSVYNGFEMTVNSSNVTYAPGMQLTTPAGGMKFSYSPPGGLAFDQTYDVQLVIFRTDGITNTINYSFTTIPNYDASYLIAPGIRNGGFEYVNGSSGSTAKVTDFSQIDNWDVVVPGGKAGTVYDTSSPQGNRYLDTDRYFKTCNMTDHVIQEGDAFVFKWVNFGRNAGVIVGLCYTNSMGVVTNIADSEVTVPDGWNNSTPLESTGTYVFTAGNPAIGAKLGLMIQDLGNNPTNDTSATESHVDKVRLYFADLSIPSVSPADGSSGVTNQPAIQAVISELASQVDTNSIVLTLDGNDVTASSMISDTSTNVTISYTPATPLSVGKHVVSLSASGTPSGTVSKTWSFSVDPTSGYLIGPGVRNGSFELVDGATGYSGDMSDWSRIDYWEADTSQQQVAKTKSSGATPIDGTRYFDTARNSLNWNLTDHVIQAGDVIDFQFTMMAERQSGVIVGLCYGDNVASVTSVSDSDVTVPDFRGNTESVESGRYVFAAGDPAIGHKLGLMIKDNGNNPTNDTTITEAYLDDVRVYAGDIAIQSVSPADGASGVASQPAIQVVIAEDAAQVNTSSIALTLDGGSVTPDTVVDTSTNVTITYTPPTALSATNHTVTVSASSVMGESVSKTWSFAVASGGTPTAPTIGSFTVGSGTVGLSWGSELGVNYYVLSTTNLITGPWTTNLMVSGDGSTISTNFSGGAESVKFFRLEAQ